MHLIGTVSETVVIAHRGVALFFTESPTQIASRSSLDVVVTRPDGTSASFAASREFARKLSSADGEEIALLIRGPSDLEIPVRSVVTAAVVSGS